MRQHVLMALLLSLTLTACTNQNWYAGAQNAQTAHCMQVPAADYKDCIKQTTESYNEYEKQRDTLKNETDSTR